MATTTTTKRKSSRGTWARVERLDASFETVPDNKGEIKSETVRFTLKSGVSVDLWFDSSDGRERIHVATARSGLDRNAVKHELQIGIAHDSTGADFTISAAKVR